MSRFFHPAVSFRREKSAPPATAPHFPVPRSVSRFRIFPDNRRTRESPSPQCADRIQLQHFRARLQSSRLIMEADPISFGARWPAFPDRRMKSDLLPLLIATIEGGLENVAINNG